jgi:hypothetical protein
MTLTRLDDIFGKIEAIERQVTGVTAVYDHEPDSVANVPCFVNEYVSSTYENAPNMLITSHVINLHLLVHKASEKQMSMRLRNLVLEVVDTFGSNVNLGGSVMHSKIASSTVTEYSSGGVPYRGVRFELQATLKEGFTYA